MATMDEISNLGVLTLEASASALIMVVVYKIYRMKCKTKSGCCGDQIHFETENAGVPENDGRV